MRQQGYLLPKNYRNLGLAFFALSLILLVFVFYLIWAKVTIVIIPNTEKTSHELIFDIKEGVKSTAEKENIVVSGKIKKIDASGSETFSATGSKTVGSDAVGEVTIINNYSKNQTLIATTRLASPDNPDKVLVRLRKTVDVPAGQKIKVQVYTDDPDNFTNLEPMRFIIPGLWQPLWDKIYAQNSQTLSREGQLVSFLTPSDLEQAESRLKDKLYQKALAEVNQQLENQEVLWPKLVLVKVAEFSPDTEVNEEVAEFTAKMILEAVIVVFNEDEFISLARNKLKSENLADKKIIDLNPKTFSYEVLNYNLDTKEANVKVSFEADSIVSGLEELLDKSKLVGLTEEEVKSYFSQFGEVKSVEVKFHPSWLKKTPRIQEKIDIEIAQ